MFEGKEPGLKGLRGVGGVEGSRAEMGLGFRATCPKIWTWATAAPQTLNPTLF